MTRYKRVDTKVSVISVNVDELNLRNRRLYTIGKMKLSISVSVI